MSYTAKDIGSLSLAECKALYLKASKLYYNSDSGKTLMSDATFDALTAAIKLLDSSWSQLKKTGAKVGKKVEVKLDVPMPSLDKIHHDDPKALTRFAALAAEYDANIIATPKFDGSALELVFDGGMPVRLRTRGDGLLGKDISYFLPYLTKQFPQRIKCHTLCVYRLESIIKHSVWAKFYSKEFDSARAMASAVFNRQDVHASLTIGHMEMKVLRVLAHAGVKTYTEGLAVASEEGFNVVSAFPALKPAQVTLERCNAILQKALASAEYRYDGIVLMSDAAGLKITGDKPDYAKAFKNNDASIRRTTTIEEIIWTVQQDGTIRPKARLSPVDFDGIEVEFATLNNAGWAKRKGCGAGAEVEVVRSGEIIPKIVNVITPQKLVLPSKSKYGEYEWTVNKDDEQVHLMLCETEGRTDVNQKLFKNTLNVLGIEHLGPSAAQLLADAGCPSSAALILGLYKKGQAMLEHAGVSPKIAAKAIATLPQMLTLPQLMEASNIYDAGFGSSRFTTLIEATADHDWYSLPLSPPTEEECVEALGNVFGRKYLNGHKEFMKFARKMQDFIQAPARKKRVTKGKLVGEIVSFTTYRNDEHEAVVEAAGAEVAKFGSKTTVLLYSKSGKASSKLNKARSVGIRVCTFEELKL